ncbi:MAG: DnaJ domain-containing protein [Proteobacteria bacterium]|nr:DnaJ domain-containing protein [Pseudomonadota bacterium]
MDNLINNCYQILGLSPGASKEEIKEAFKKIRDELSTKEDEWERLKEINWAYEVLVDSVAAATGKDNVPEDDKAKRKRYKDNGESDVITLKDFLFSVGDKINPFLFAGRALVFLITIIWGFKYITHSVASNYAGESFLHNVSLPFHEAGHIILSPLGDFMCVLGGSLFQILIPAICMGAFLKQNDVFGASIALWWIGQNFVDCAPYINDARAQELMLLGGVTGQDVPGIHDWNNILGTLGLLKLDHFIANTSHWFGILLMLAAFLWGGLLLWLQWKNIDS